LRQAPPSFRSAVFVDTSAFFALADQTDRNHAAARKYVEDVATSLFTSNVIVHETITLVRMRLGYEPAVLFGRRLLVETAFPVVHVTPDDERQAWKIFQRYRDKRLSFVDCTSFAVMQRLGIQAAFAFDDDFRQVGKWIVQPSGEGG